MAMNEFPWNLLFLVADASGTEPAPTRPMGGLIFYYNHKLILLWIMIFNAYIELVTKNKLQDLNESLVPAVQLVTR